MRIRPIERGAQEGRLADARLTVDQEAGETMGRLLQEALDRLKLPCPSDEVGGPESIPHLATLRPATQRARGSADGFGFDYSMRKVVERRHPG